ncbi:glycosyltransferase family 4 protein [Sphingomonas folli]|uniref:glycosyltransferase family 4 protein n=1 Tax=Sphingomonas folli TaxID=2862497 RepID=UPI0027E468B5|nr:glycosyltransferase family 1 protein [Sphingomonas folli]
MSHEPPPPARLTLPLCLDARMLGDGGTGVATYARALATATRALTDRPYRLVAEHTDDGRAARWSGAVPRAARHLRAGADADGATLLGRDLFRRAHVHFDLYRRLMPLRCDLPAGIMHWTYPVPLRVEGWINLYTVHDAIPLDRPELTPIAPRRHRAVLDAIVAGGDGITTVSQAARAAIVAALGCDPAFVVDTGQPVDVAEAARASLPVGLTPRGYLLAVGTVEPRKNLVALLAAYRRSGTELPLLIAGPDGWEAGPILADIAATPGAIRLRYPPRELLVTLLAEARALLFPSLAEGFGLPVAEAMALGTPVLAGGTGAPAEVAGGAALLVDVTDVDSIAAAITRLANDDALVRDLAARGRARAPAFAPSRFAERLAAIYRAALQRRAAASNGRSP